MVNRCICSNITFREIKDVAEQNGYSSVPELREAGVCALHCRICEPYVEKVLETGEVVFEPFYTSNK